MKPVPDPHRPDSLWHPQLRWTSLGALVLILLSAFEAMAVTTVMPQVAADLDGERLYSVAFSATLAASVIAMVIAGRWSDRSGPSAPLLTAIGLFLLGLVVAGTATSMPVLIAGRFAQGLGGGAVTVTLYVVVARRYPPLLHPRVFGMFAAAWVLPSMVGPFLAGVIADALTWHWVFLGVAILVLPALALLAPSLAAVRGPAPAAPDGADTPAADAAAEAARPSLATGIAVVLAVVVALALVATGSLADLSQGPTAWLAAGGLLAIVALAVRPLLPAGTLTARTGLPSTVALRGVIVAGYFGTEVYLPLLLQREYGLSASLSGLVLTVGALAWSTGSAVQARMGARVPSAVLLVRGSLFVVAGVAIQVATALADLGVAGALVGWLVGGLGMGLAFPRISTMVLALSAPWEQGANSSALAISDAVGGSAATAVTGLLFAAVVAAGGSGMNAFAACFTLCLVIALGAVAVARRAGAGSDGRMGAAVALDGRMAA